MSRSAEQIRRVASAATTDMGDRSCSHPQTPKRNKKFWKRLRSLPTLLFIAILLFSPAVAAMPVQNPAENMPQEINPVTPKFKTVADPGMPGSPDFGLDAKDNLVRWDDEKMALTTTSFMPGMFQTRLGLANGYAGATVAAAGPFFERDFNQTNHNGMQPSEGWPLRNPRQTFGTISGFFDCQATTPETNFEELRDRGCESVISGTPHPLGLHLVIGDQVLNSTVDKSTISNFSQTMSYQDGVAQWKYTWAPKMAVNESVKFDIEMTSFMHRTRANVAASELRVTPRGGNYNASIVDLLDGRSAVRSSLQQKGMSAGPTSTIWVGNNPEGLPDVTAWTFSTTNVSNGYTDESSRRRAASMEDGSDMSVGQEWDIRLLDGETAVFQKFVGLASSDKFPGSEAFDVSSAQSLQAYRDGWDGVVGEHKDAWNDLMSKDRILNLRDPVTGLLPTNDEHIAQLQIMHTTSQFYLLQNLLKNGSNLNDNSISVGGLTSDAYGGMVFWDADFWMFPSILETNPDYAAQIPNYRLKLYPQAKANTQEDYVQEKYKFDNESALYSWTSGRFGNATGTGPVADYEEHINAITAISMFQWLAVTGDESTFKDKYLPVVNSIGHTIATLLQKDGDGYSIRNMTDPDEYANHVDNGAFTLAAFSQVLSQINSYRASHNLPLNQTWLDMQHKINLPIDLATGITKEYQGMQNNITVKQADVTMLSYPLLVTNYTLSDSIRDLRYYSQKQTPDGPAMTNAIAAIAENRVAENGCAAFVMDMQSSLPNLRAPWFQISEQIDDDANANGGTSPAFPFLTGHGGALQIPLYGYLGLARSLDGLTIRPSLPPPYEHMQMPEFYRAGNRFKASMNSTHTNITRLPNIHHSQIVDLYPSQAMPLTVERRNGSAISAEQLPISMNETLTVANDMYWTRRSAEGNLAQCQPASGATIKGQYPHAAVDGNPVTYWQPPTRAATNLTISLSPFPAAQNGGKQIFQPIRGVRIDWGARVPSAARVILTNSTTTNTSTAPANKSVVLTLHPVPNTSCDGDGDGDGNGNGTPLPPVDDPAKIHLYRGNCTMHRLATGNGDADGDMDRDSGVWSAKYAILEIEGCEGCEDSGAADGAGATVGEFEILGA